jgi:hypothetical protein
VKGLCRAEREEGGSELAMGMVHVIFIKILETIM